MKLLIHTMLLKKVKLVYYMLRQIDTCNVSAKSVQFRNVLILYDPKMLPLNV